MNPYPIFVALIATCNRPTLLARRALPSVAAQIRRPDILIVSDDSAPQFRARNKKAVEDFAAQNDISIRYVINRRSKGASGAWNTGALTALNGLSEHDTRNTYLAILDDDDEWLPEHLEQAQNVLYQAGGRSIDLMSSAFERCEAKQRYVITPPTEINGTDFLIGNPGVIGSTHIIRISAFMRAGMFDESLPACTDRDLYFRLSLLPDITYKSLPETSVIHYANEHRTRLSNKGGKIKCLGLSRFANKYRGWMSNAEYAAFCKRAKKLFGWTAVKPKIKSTIANKKPVGNEKINDNKKVALIIGVIVHPQQQDNPLFSDILALAKDKRLSSVDVVVMPSADSHRQILSDEMAKLRQAGLRIHCVPAPYTIKPLRDFFALNKSRTMRPITVNRTILQHAVSRLAVLYRNPVCWVLDGDSRLHELTSANRRITSFHPDYVGEIIKLHNSGCDIAIGEINGAAPLPRAFTVRTQMLDMMHALGRLKSPMKGQHCPTNIADINSENIDKNYYHDCFPQPHLEQPIGISPLPQACSLSQFTRKLPHLLDRILAGDAVTRPLLSNSGTTSIHRGGNTLIFNPAALSDCPNGLARGDLCGMRRQDEIWRIVNEKIFNRKVVAGFFPVTQSRESEPPQAPDINRMVNDIAGHAVVTALRNIRTIGCSNNPKSFIDRILQADSRFFDKVKEAADIRLSTVRASFFRIGGIAASMRAMLSAENKENNITAVNALTKIEYLFSDKAFAALQRKTMRLLNDATLKNALLEFPQTSQDFTMLQKLWSSWISNEQRANAVVLLTSRKISALRFLRQGNEGTVFTNGQHVFKVLHRWDSRIDIDDASFLPSLAGKWKADSTVYPVLKAVNDGGDLILMLPFEKTSPYKGGYGNGLVALLAELKKHGIVSWDMAPQNLRRKGKSVHLIDYGRDIKPFTEKDFDLSVRKAWLCWRWAWRDDIRALLTASLKNPQMPELTGHETMKAAILQYAKRSRIADTAINEVIKNTPHRVLDYGCGNKINSIALNKRGVHVDAFDPALTTAMRLQAAGVRVVKDITATQGKYNAILLRHVICEIPSDNELRECLNNIHRLLSPKGKVVVTTCDMSGLVKDNTCAHNMLPKTANAEHKFLYRKLIRTTGNIRAHVHRPESMIKREFSRAGFRVVSRRAFSDIDINRFETCGGVLQWTLEPMPTVSVTTNIHGGKRSEKQKGKQ